MALPLCSLPAAAESPIAIEANVGVVSDYRFRGISLSDRDPALQGGIDISHTSGLFVGTWASTIADYGGAETELDIYGGYAGSIGGTEYTLGAYAYLYPGGADVNYVEFQAEASRAVGPITLTGTLAYTPEQQNVGDVDNVYLGAKAEHGWDAVPLTLYARGGYESGFYDDKLDWEVGATYALEPVQLGASIVGSNYGGRDEAGRLGGTAVLLSALATF